LATGRPLPEGSSIVRIAGVHSGGSSVGTRGALSGWWSREPGVRSADGIDTAAVPAGVPMVFNVIAHIE